MRKVLGRLMKPKGRVVQSEVQCLPRRRSLETTQAFNWDSCGVYARDKCEVEFHLSLAGPKLILESCHFSD